MTAQPSLLRRFSVCLALFALAAVTCAPALAETSRDFSFDADQLTVVNMIGGIKVVPASGDQFEVKVAVRGEDARDGVLEFLTEKGGKASLVVKFPVQEERDFVYPELGSGSKTTITYSDGDDHGGSWLKKIFADLSGTRVTVRGRGKGLEVWADITIAVPQGGELDVENRVGAIEASRVEGDLGLDTGSGSVSVSGVRGDVWVDTGSGSVSVTGAEGDKVEIDTGSGSVEVRDVKARTIEIDTGSGGVRLEMVRCQALGVDTGSGGVKARRVEADRAAIDTGSGSVLLQLDRMGQGRFEIDTGSGSIELQVPDDASARISAETSSGGVRNEISGAEVRSKDKNEMELTVGDGAARVILDAGSGSITVSGR